MLSATEVITSGTDRCVEVVDVELNRLADGRLAYTAYGGRAVGALTRVTALTGDTVAPFLGTWTGAVEQVGSRPYTVRLELAWEGSQLTGPTTYPELGNCQAVLEDPVLTAGTLSVAERVTVTGNRCVDTVVDLTLNGDQLDYAFDVDGEGRAILSRV